MPDLLFLMQRLPYPLIKGEKVRFESIFELNFPRHSIASKLCRVNARVTGVRLSRIDSS